MEFTKMHGLGNDFIVIENFDCAIRELSNLAIRICDRHTGIGADGVLVVENSQIADIKMRVINSDGSEAEMCGNGIRCFARYVFDRGHVDKKNIEIETLAGTMIVRLEVDNNDVMSIRVKMGVPTFEKELIPFKGEEDNSDYRLIVGDKDYRASTLLLGVPHTVLFVDELDNDEIVFMGKKIERLSHFPKGTNINFVKIIDKNHIELRTFERGAGFTLACGTGTCASVVAANKLGLVSDKVFARLTIGSLKIELAENTVIMEGPADYICEGTLL